MYSWSYKELPRKFNEERLRYFKREYAILANLGFEALT